jgi:hypothetical protein
MGIVEIFLRQKEGYYEYYLYIYILTDTKLYYLNSRDLKGSYLSLEFLSRSQLVA